MATVGYNDYRINKGGTMKGKKITSLQPLEGALDFLSSMPAVLTNNHRTDVFTDELEGISIDTCKATDTRIWETGINREHIEGKWVIVSQYKDREEAEIKHKEWVEEMRKNPDAPLKDIDMWNLGLNEDEDKD